MRVTLVRIESRVNQATPQIANQPIYKTKLHNLSEKGLSTCEIILKVNHSDYWKITVSVLLIVGMIRVTMITELKKRNNLNVDDATRIMVEGTITLVTFDWLIGLLIYWLDEWSKD